MSLRVWLPLNGDLTNNGLSNITVTNNGATIDNNGKIGKCYSFDGTNDYMFVSPSFLSNSSTEWSYCCWMKLRSTQYGCLFSDRTSTSLNGLAIFYYGSQWIIDDGVRWQFIPTVALSINTWYHITVVIKRGVGKYLYVNGELDSSTTTTGTPTIVNTARFSIGASMNSATTVNANYFSGYLNDVRIYDHALSAKEVKEISKGLVCHYKLDSQYSTDNLILNGFGENGSENWTSSTLISTTEIPSGHSEIKASFYNGNMTKEYIPLNQNHSYTISGYIKSSGATSGTTYPSIYPYDIDKKFINNYNTIAGFTNSFKTTLARPLKKGDTIIYATDLSAWTTATNNHYYFVAIFGYKDSTGYIYPDMVYTQDCPVFGSYSDKSNIDKTNNTVTLKSAYTGEDRPAGTTICQATAGGTYYYPWGGVSLSSIQDWTFKTATFIPKNNNRLVACKYIRWSTYSNCYIAGNQLIDNDDNSNLIYDSSGYNYHGTPSGNLTVSNDTARNSLSTVFNISSTDTIQMPSIYSIGQSIEKLSVNIWFKTNTLNGTLPNLWSLGNNYFARIRLANSSSIWFYLNMGSSSTKKSATYNTKTLTDNVWHNVIFVFNSGIVIIYLDGEQIGTSDFSSTATFLNVQHNGWYLAGYNATAEKFLGSLSDFRIYSTVLSADDVKELYQLGASIDKSGNVFAYEFKEV